MYGDTCFMEGCEEKRYQQYNWEKRGEDGTYIEVSITVCQQHDQEMHENWDEPGNKVVDAILRRINAA